MDLSKQINWSYHADGMLQERKDQQGQPITYTYDAENQLVFSHDASGLTTPLQTFVDTRNSYDDLGRLVRSDLRKPKPGVNVNWTFSSFGYDLNGNVTDQVQNGEEQNGPNDLPNGVVVKAGRSLHNDYDQANWITTQLDFGTDPGAADDQRTLNSFTPLGLESRREIDKSNGAGGWTAKQVSSWDYFDNGKLNHLTTTAAGGASLESHAVSYLDSGGIYNNGNRTQDTFSLKPGSAASGDCYPGSCTTSYVYDPRDRLVSQLRNPGAISTTYSLDPAGNILSEATTGAPTKTSNYVGSRLDTIVAGGQTQKYNYDPFGRLHCVTTADGSEADCSAQPTGSLKLIQNYEYDYLDRLVSYGTFSNGTRTDHAEYVYDALNRVASQTEEHPSFTKRTTQFSYLGLGGQLTQEQQTDSSGVLGTKDYSYHAFGHRLSQTVSGSTLRGVPNGTFTYGYDVHGSVSQVVDTDGNSRASYGYLPYGQTDSTLSQGDTNQLNPINPFRYSAKRSDTGSSTVDMGVRRFGPDTSRFLTPDLFFGALANLSLSLDLLTQNRYGLAGGNPLGFREWDGHELVEDGGGGAATEPAPKQNKQEIPCRPSLDNFSEYEDCRPPVRPIPSVATYEEQRKVRSRICGPALVGALGAQQVCVDFSFLGRGKGEKPAGEQGGSKGVTGGSESGIGGVLASLLSQTARVAGRLLGKTGEEASTAERAVQAPVEKALGEFERIYQTEQGPVGLLGEAAIRGTTFELRNVAIYPYGAETLRIGVAGVRAGLTALREEAAGMGFEQLGLSGE